MTAVETTETAVVLHAADGWPLGALHTVPAGAPVRGGVVLVHASHHERDAFTYGLSVPDLLAGSGLACLRLDIRGRGTSRNGRDYHRFAPQDRRAVALDVAAALDHVAGTIESPRGRLGVLGEQDTATAVAVAVAGDDRVGALALLSPRLPASAEEALRVRAVPTFALVSKEDRHALRDSTAAYLAGPEIGSRLDVFSGLGFGTTMFATRAFEQTGEPSLEALITAWFAERLG